MQRLLELRRFLDEPLKPVARAVPRCELCAAELGSDHPHVIDCDSRRLMCACRPCYLLFSHPGAAGGRYRSVGERYAQLTGHGLDGLQWEAFDIPAGIAFFLRSSTAGRILGFYPSPAGATESLLPSEAWDGIVASNPVLLTLETDVEALLVCRRRERNDSWIVPVDACYELVGRIRRTWRGFDGGEEGRREIDAFFTGLRQREQGGAACSI